MVLFRAEFIFIFVLFALTSAAQDRKVITVDIVQMKSGYEKEVLYFYENNWKVYRDSALNRGFITGYQLLQQFDSSGKNQVMLLTMYKNREMYEKRETLFRPIMSALRPNGPVYLNHLRRNEMLEIASALVTESLFEGVGN